MTRQKDPQQIRGRAARARGCGFRQTRPKPWRHQGCQERREDVKRRKPAFDEVLGQRARPFYRQRHAAAFRAGRLAALARACRFQHRSRYCRDLHHWRAVWLPTAGGVDRGAAVSALRPRLSRLVQDLERGHGRRQHLHVAAGRGSDLEMDPVLAGLRRHRRPAPRHLRAAGS